MRIYDCAYNYSIHTSIFLMFKILCLCCSSALWGGFVMHLLLVAAVLLVQCLVGSISPQYVDVKRSALNAIWNSERRKRCLRCLALVSSLGLQELQNSTKKSVRSAKPKKQISSGLTGDSLLFLYTPRELYIHRFVCS